MGWTYNHRGSGISVSEHLMDSGVFKWSDDAPCTYKVLKTALVKLKTFYAAIECINKTTGERRVFAAIILIHMINRGRDYHNFGYKDMDETCGPVESECPASILDLLTPTDSEYAQEWRERCRENLQSKMDFPKIKCGDKIKFDHPIRFTNGAEETQFTVLDTNRGKSFILQALTIPGRFKLSRSYIASHLSDNSVHFND